MLALARHTNVVVVVAAAAANDVSSILIASFRILFYLKASARVNMEWQDATLHIN